jgi:hypothetical protein
VNRNAAVIACSFALMTISFTAVHTQPALAQSGRMDNRAYGKPVPPMPADPRVAAAIAKISPERIRQDITALVDFHNRSTLGSDDKDTPKGQGVLAAADWVEAQYQSYSKACGGCLEVRRDTFTQPVGPRIARPTVLNNIYAVLRGTDPEQAKRVVLVTGHYDSRDSTNEDTKGLAPGANDDASGVAVSLECARVLSQLRFPATIVFAAVPGEEQGLYGSRHLAQLAKQEGWQIEAVLNNDIVGGNTTPGDTLQDKQVVRVFSEGIPATASDQQLRMIRMLGGESDSPSREVAREVAAVSETYTAGHGSGQAFRPVLEFRLDRYLRGGDHYSFNQEGFPAVRFTEWREDFNHQHQNVRVENGVQYGDLLKFVDFDYVARVARLNAASLATMAAAPGMPENVRVVTSELDNNTQLKWEPPAGAPAGTKYDVVWRDTSAPDWQFYTSAGSATTITVPVSKDNVIFGVEAVNAKGQRSPAVFPFPERFRTPPVQHKGQ